MRLTQVSRKRNAMLMVWLKPKDSPVYYCFTIRLSHAWYIVMFVSNINLARKSTILKSSFLKSTQETYRDLRVGVKYDVVCNCVRILPVCALVSCYVSGEVGELKSRSIISRISCSTSCCQLPSKLPNNVRIQEMLNCMSHSIKHMISHAGLNTDDTAGLIQVVGYSTTFFYSILYIYTVE